MEFQTQIMQMLQHLDTDFSGGVLLHRDPEETLSGGNDPNTTLKEPKSNKQ